jgi:hypothetical protein
VNLCFICQGQIYALIAVYNSNTAYYAPLQSLAIPVKADIYFNPMETVLLLPHAVSLIVKLAKKEIVKYA